MTYLAMDVDRVGALTERLRAGAGLADDAQYYLAQAELLADLPVICGLELDQITHDFGRMADQVDWAAELLRSLRLDFASVFDWRGLPQPVRTPVPVPASARAVPGALGQVRPAQWDATHNQSWHQVHQLSSHNSYEAPGGAQVLFDQGVRSYELDVHHRSPTDFIAAFCAGTRRTMGQRVHRIR